MARLQEPERHKAVNEKRLYPPPTYTKAVYLTDQVSAGTEFGFLSGVSMVLGYLHYADVLLLNQF